ncbi:hypothetical protein J8273_0613 [Carpediemonas membranifera]|uniref:Uncharacterized protein n=1 Tax=Carpediemonas membranifera TaxID=201153 RepID=A0A8J6AYZ5_9EUKA|nr:hypothetical protein J8273_0613 [Carpediemonas membranifera]|eukprot:KAG9397483.1 hypothetical protein J8273_0613 [Carpediemonas membranifera]
MPGSESTSPSVMDDLTTAYRQSLVVASDIPGDIPSLLRHAFSRHFKQNMPAVQRKEAETPPSSVTDVAELLAMLISIPSLEPTAQVLLDCARSILTSGPRVSMNVELADGEELPVALHTLLQGTLFAVLVHGGADPDLERTVEQAERQRVGYSQEDKLPWFLCKKFAFVHQVAAKDGQTATDVNNSIAHRMYAGRIFELVPEQQILKHTLVRLPPVARAFGLGTLTLLAATPAGTYGIDYHIRHILFDESDNGNPTQMKTPARIFFRFCPRVAEFERSKPTWHKHEVVLDAGFYGNSCVILTPVDTVIAGVMGLDGVRLDCHPFNLHPAPLPDGFVAQMALIDKKTVVLTAESGLQVIVGQNLFGRLGVGHMGKLTEFEYLSEYVDKIIYSGDFFLIFQSGLQIMYAGKVNQVISRSGLLPDSSFNDILAYPRPLVFTHHLHRFYCSECLLVTVHDGQTHVIRVDTNALAIVRFSLPFQATTMAHRPSHDSTAILFRDEAGQWYSVAVQPNAEHHPERVGGCPRGYGIVPLPLVDVGPVDVGRPELSNEEW